MLIAFHRSRNISVLPASPNNLHITFEAVMTDTMPEAPLSWILNDSCPDMGSLAQIWPTSEMALFLRTLYLTDSPQLEQRLLKNVKRLLGKRSLQNVATASGLSSGVCSPVAWALLWVPDRLDTDGNVTQVNMGNHRLWPKLLLSLPMDAVSSGQADENGNSTSLQSRLSVDDGHTEIKKSKALFKESLEIHLAVARSENEKPVPTKDDEEANASSRGPTSLFQGTKMDDYQSLGTETTKGDAWQLGIDQTQEDEDDLFASSPSPALPNDTQIPQNTEDKPSALDSVEGVSTSLFSPTQQAHANFDVAKYDISPTNKGSPIRGYPGFEPMITDDDFDFFDGQNPLNQQETYEEYGDLANGDFGVNMNQAPSSRPAESGTAPANDDMGTALFTEDTMTAGELFMSSAVNRGVTQSPRDPAITSPASIRSDDDLWNDNSLLEQFEESIQDATTGITEDDDRIMELEANEASTTVPLPLAFDPTASIISAISTGARLDPVKAIPRVSDNIDYGRPLQWTVAIAAENLTPADFQEIVFDQPFFKATDIEKLSLSVDGTICLTDLYGDGRVRIRKDLVELLEAQESARRNRNLGLLPFHAQNAIDEVDISSPRSATSQDTQDSGASIDEASEVASVSQSYEGEDCRGILQSGHYPFGELDAFFRRRYLNSLEEQDRTTLHRKMIEAEDLDSMTSPLTELSTIRSRDTSQIFELALVNPHNGKRYSHFPSASSTSEQAEYNGKIPLVMLISQLILSRRRFRRYQCPGPRRIERQRNGTIERSTAPLVRIRAGADMRKTEHPDFNPLRARNRHVGSQGVLSRRCPSICCRCNVAMGFADFLT